jgi:hypothetical protein
MVFVNLAKQKDKDTVCRWYSSSADGISNIVYIYKGKGKGEVHPRTGHEGPERGVEV